MMAAAVNMAYDLTTHTACKNRYASFLICSNSVYILNGMPSQGLGNQHNKDLHP